MAPRTELWENMSDSSLTLKRYGPRDTVVGEIIRGHRKIEITPEERRMNQDAVYDQEKNDPFSNGKLRPLRLIETEEDVAEIRDNPNTLGETEMRGLLADRRATKKLTAKIDEISNPITLQRFIEIAREEDASVKQLESIQARLQQVAPQSYVSGSGDAIGVSLEPPAVG